MNQAMKVRKKPVVVEAAFFDQDKKGSLPQEFFDALCVCGVRIPEQRMRWHVHTIEGSKAFLTDGCYIIKGVKGEFYPCDSEIFMATYERVTP